MQISVDLIQINIIIRESKIWIKKEFWLFKSLFSKTYCVSLMTQELCIFK